MITPVPLGTWPTPLEAAPRLAAQLGLAELWFKRDDLSGLGGGGNKIRKLRYTCAQAIAVGATTVITSGAPQSNHARLTAAAAARLGLSCVLVLAGSPPERRRGNLLLDGFAGAEIVWSGDRPLAEVVAVEAERRSAYLIPFGGTSPASIQGYVDCGRELRAQLPTSDGVEVVTALGSGGTMAGLVRELGAERVIGVDVGALPDPRATVAGLLGGEVDPDALRIDGTQVGAGYRHADRRRPVRAGGDRACRGDLPGPHVHRSGDGGAAGGQFPARRPGRLSAQRWAAGPLRPPRAVGVSVTVPSGGIALGRGMATLPATGQDTEG